MAYSRVALLLMTAGGGGSAAAASGLGAGAVFGGIHLDPMDLRWIPGALLLPWTVPGLSGRFQRVVVGIREALELFKFKWG